MCSLWSTQVLCDDLEDGLLFWLEALLLLPHEMEIGARASRAASCIGAYGHSFWFEVEQRQLNDSLDAAFAVC